MISRGKIPISSQGRNTSSKNTRAYFSPTLAAAKFFCPLPRHFPSATAQYMEIHTRLKKISIYDTIIIGGKKKGAQALEKAVPPQAGSRRFTAETPHGRKRASAG